MEKRHPLVQLAQDTFPWLSDQVTKVASQKSNPKLGGLGARLYIFSDRTSHLSDSQKRHLERDGLVQPVLAHLEAMLSTSSASAKSGTKQAPTLSYIGPTFPMLENIADALKDATDGGQRGKQGLTALERTIASALLSRRVDFKAAFSAFDDCFRVSPADELDAEPLVSEPGSGKDDLVGYEKYARELHRILVRYASCSCNSLNREDRHWARLRLKPVYQADKSSQIPFDMLFSASPNPPRTLQVEWQDVRILVPTTKPTRRVQWAQAETTSTTSENQAGGTEDGAYECVESLCSLISSRCGSLLSFKATKEQLMVLREATDISSRHSIQHDQSPGLQLGEILRRFNMRHGTRPVLAYILAKAVWYYYNSDWMSMGITKDNVYFVGQTRDDEVAYFCKPYLSTQLPPEGNQTVECRQVFGMIHRYPRVLALGILLAEIATGQRFETDGHPDHWDPKTVNQQFFTIQNLLTSGEFHEDCKYPRYRAAVKKCLDPMLFQNAPFNPKKPSENLERRRSILYSEIVDPLRQLIEGTGWVTELDEFEQTVLVPKPMAKPQPKSPTQVTATEMPVPAAPKCDPWLKEMASLNQMLRQKRKKSSANSSPLKIAILDTGYDNNTPAFDIPSRSRRIKGWKDFVSNSPQPVDTDGHGTHLLTLLLQLECPASIYAARVAENSRTLKSAEGAIAEAIRIAATEWDVDFISLSFGFPRHVQSIRDAIADAIHIKRGAITFFAAANNDGFNSREMFPANLGESVISVRGTNRAGGFESKYNPPTSSDEPVFGTLGLDVVSDWPGQETGRSMSGCSVATPIAVAIAVMLLEYAAARPNDFGSDDLRLMRTRRGVFELFKEVGIHAGDKRYYVAPFNLFKLTEDVRLAKMKAALGNHPERW